MRPSELFLFSSLSIWSCFKRESLVFLSAWASSSREDLALSLYSRRSKEFSSRKFSLSSF